MKHDEHESGSHKSEKRARVTAKEFPALAEFFAGYLHEDYREEYASVKAAAAGFLAEADAEERESIYEEWQRLQRQLEGTPFEERKTAARALGAAWEPRDLAEWRDLGEILSAA